MVSQKTIKTIGEEKCPRCQETLLFKPITFEGKRFLATACCGEDIDGLVKDWGYGKTTKPCVCEKARTKREDVACFICGKGADVIDGNLPFKLSSEWDDNECGKTNTSPIFFEDNKCPCGIKKHHYHCNVCGKVLQIG